MAIPVNWSIRNLDTGALITPQLPIDGDGVRVSGGATVAEAARFGFEDPVIHWTGGKGRTLTFATMLYARTSAEAVDVEAMLDTLQRLCAKDPKLGRPPICLFTFGSTVSETVLVLDVDPVIRSVEPVLGQPREVELSITMKRYTPFSQTAINPSRPAKLSFYLVASQLEQSYEAIAKRFYGNPLLGDRLRKMHPAYPLRPALGSIVHVPPRGVIARQVVEPSFHALRLDDPEALVAYANILEARSLRKLIEVT